VLCGESHRLANFFSSFPLLSDRLSGAPRELGSRLLQTLPLPASFVPHPDDPTTYTREASTLIVDVRRMTSSSS
jgi:hypothetical protein